ncbi:hypothetical protein ABTZ58_03645 [Streptomyces sp. NPDC094143]|uniref:hypothetical protein n=1 Tax=unclassified Streptomyces TaxID=2593676 RepID=UPI00332F135D
MSPARKTGHESWDAFWAEASGGRTTVIRGVEVPVPTDVPLAMEQRIEELQDSESKEDLAELLAMLFGQDVLDQWMDAGMGMLELQTVMAWAMAQAGGRDITFGEALELVRSGEAGKLPGPKGPNRAARRATGAPAKRSAAGGGRSAQTSAANTASRRKTSRA